MNKFFLFLLLIGAYSVRAQDIHTDTLKGNLLYEKGKELQKIHKYQAAIDAFETAGLLYEKHEVYDKYFQVQNGIVINYRILSEQKKAILVGNQIIEACRKIYGAGNKHEANALSNIGISETILKNYDEAIDLHQKAIVIFKALDLPQNLANVYNNLGIVYYYKGDLEEALKWYKKYELLLLELGDKSGLSGLYNNTGVLYYRIGDTEEALEHMSKALDLELQVGKANVNEMRLVQRYQNISVLCQSNKQLDRAIEFLEKAELTLSKLKKEDDPFFANLYSIRAAILMDQNRKNEALKYYQKELEILKKTNADPEKLSRVYLNLGGTMFLFKKEAQGLEYVNEAIRIVKTMGADNRHLLIMPYKNKGALYLEQGDFESFMLNYRASLDIAERQYGQKHPQIAEIYTDIAKALAKREAFEEAFDYFDKALEAIVATEEQDYNKIIQNKDYLDLAIFRVYLGERGKANFSRYLKTKDKTYLDKAYEELLVVQKCIEVDKNNIKQDKDKQGLLKRTGLMSGVLLDVACAYRVLGTQAPIEMAFKVAEKNKSAILLEALRSASAHKFGNLSDSIQGQEETLRKEIGTLEKNILDAQVEQQQARTITLKSELFAKKRNLEDLYERIRKEHPSYVEFKQGTDVDINMLQDKILDNETALVEYYITDSACYQFVLTKTSLNLISLPISKRAIDLKMLQFRRSISNYKYILNKEKKAYKDYTTTAYWFYKQLIQPIEKKTKGIKKLIIVPDNTLGHIPFEAFLVQPVETEQPYATMDYLLNHYSIRYSYSASLLVENKKHRPAKKSDEVNLLAFAAAYNLEETESMTKMRTLRQQQLRKQLKPLPATQIELQQLQTVFPKGSFYDGEQATEAQFKASVEQATVLHLAMHGILNNNHPIASSLVFTEDGDRLEDNFLYAYEISQMTMPLDLVVLSACETGYGKFEWGEGVMSMARSFMFAGVPSLVVSLWQVNDASTALIMEDFYRNLSKGMDKDVALSETKRAYLKYAEGIAAHPAYWAPFIQLGDAQALVEIKTNNNWLWGAVVFFFVLIGGVFLRINKNK